MNQGKDTLFLKTCTDEYLDLLAEQERLRTEVFKSSNVAREGYSIAETLASIIKHAKNVTRPNDVNRVLLEGDKFAKKFRIPEKMTWSVKVQSFSDSGQWDALRALAESRGKNPIGFKPFATAAIRGRRPQQEVVRYIERVLQPEERFDLYLQGELWNQAVNAAAAMKDEGRVHRVLSGCEIPEIQRRCEKILQDMRTR